MDNAPLHNNIFKYRFCPFLEPRHSIHTYKKNVFNTTRLDFIEDLHLIVFAF